jgi:hypothetical protein
MRKHTLKSVGSSSSKPDQDLNETALMNITLLKIQYIQSFRSRAINLAPKFMYGRLRNGLFNIIIIANNEKITHPFIYS